MSSQDACRDRNGEATTTIVSPSRPLHISSVVLFVQWLLQSGPKSSKHRGKWHPLTTFVIHYLLEMLTTILAHDVLVIVVTANSSTHGDKMDCTASSFLLGSSRQQSRRAHIVVAVGLAIYFLVIFGWRLALHLWDTTTVTTSTTHHLLWPEFYRQTFLCSVTLVASSVGLATNRPLIASAHMLAVGIDQLLWYLDLSVYLVLGTFPVGCTRYLFWEGTTWSSRITSTHHLWTIPLLLWVCGGCHIMALPLSFVVVTVNVVLSRVMTPIQIDFPMDELWPREGTEKDDKNEMEKPGKMLYLNLNMSHELWTDISFHFLRAGEDSVPYLIRLLIGWFLCNTIVYGLLSSTVVLFPSFWAQEPPVCIARLWQPK